MEILPGVDTDIDCREVDPIHQKRSLAFINHFVLRTVTFLNSFAKSCESKFLVFEDKLQKIEASICVLESKLASIPELNDIEQSPTYLPLVETQLVESHNGNEEKQETPNNNTVLNELENDTIFLKDDPKYARYFKMLQFGVPEQGVRIKLQADGLDPNIISQPMKKVSRSAEVENVGENSNSSDED